MYVTQFDIVCILVSLMLYVCFQVLCCMYVFEFDVVILNG
jgi:hypothetical protein